MYMAKRLHAFIYFVWGGGEQLAYRFGSLNPGEDPQPPTEQMAGCVTDSVNFLEITEVSIRFQVSYHISSDMQNMA